MLSEETLLQVEKPSKLGVVSLIISIIGCIGLCLSTVAFPFMATGAGDAVVLLIGFLGLVLIFVALVLLIGILLGVLAIFKKESPKSIPIIGLILNVVILCPTVLLAGLAVYGFLSLV